jgi:hypothetical protein
MFKIHDGRDIFYQWDTDRKIIVSDPSITEIHFSNGTNNRALVVGVYEQDGARLANVPNVLLQERWDIMAYAYCGDCYTKQSARFKVNARPKPEDYIYEETEIKSLAYLENRIEEVESIAKGAINGKSFADLEELVNTLVVANDTEFVQSQHLLIATLGIPDLWIYEISSQHFHYDYSSDADFCAELKDTGFVQVGYFVLAPLETQKVDLTDYVKNTDYASATKAGLVKYSAANGTYIDPSTGMISVVGATACTALIATGVNPLVACAVLPSLAASSGLTPPLAAGMYACMGIAESGFKETAVVMIKYLLSQMVVAILLLVGVLPIFIA